MMNQLKESIKNKRKIVFVDEVMFTYSTSQKLEFSNKKKNIIAKDKLGMTASLAVVAAISIEKGLEEYYIYDKSINVDKFNNFLLGLFDKNTASLLSIMLDNLRVHHSKQVKDICKQFDTQLIFTPAYSPEINPIENYFSLIKNKYKRLKINDIANNIKINPRQLIKQSFQQIDDNIVKDLCVKKMNKLGLSYQ